MKKQCLPKGFGFVLLLAVCFTVLFAATAVADVHGTCGTVDWTIQDDGSMVFSPTDGIEGTLAEVEEESPPWLAYRDQVKSVSFTGTVHAAADSSYLLANLSSLTSVNLTNFDTSGATNIEGFIGLCTSLKHVDLTGMDVSNVRNFQYVFYGDSALESVDLSTWNTAQGTTFSGFFYQCENLKSADLSNFNTASATSLSHFFNGCRSLETVNVSSFDTSNVRGTGMVYIFQDCASLTSLDVSNFDFSKITGAYNLFANCVSLETITLPDVLDFSSATNMSYMFMECLSLKNMDLSRLVTTTKLAAAQSMFGECESLETLDLTGLNVTNVSYFSDFLHGCERLTKLTLGPNFYSSKKLSNGFLRGIWQYDGDGKEYLSTEISERLFQGPMAGTFTKVGNTALAIPFAIDYSITRFQVIDSFTTTNPEIKRSGNMIYMQIDGASVDEENTLKVDGSFSVYLHNAVVDAVGNPYILKITYDNIVLYDADQIVTTDGTTYTSYYHQFFKINENGIASIMGEDRERLSAVKDPSESTNASYDITLQILDPSGQPAQGSFLFSIYDLDIGSLKDKREAYNQPSVERSNQAYGLYSEGVYLKTGFDIDSIVVADNTYLNMKGYDAAYEGYRVHGTQIDSASERTDLIVKADAAGSTFRWTGFSCEDFLFYLYQPKPVHIEKVNEQGRRIVGAKLELYRVLDSGAEELIDTWTSEASTTRSFFLLSGRYILKETEWPTGYEKAADIEFLVDTDFDVCDMDGTKQGDNTVKMTDPREVLSIPVQKQWVDAGNVLGKRPASIQLNLLKDGVPAAAVTVKPDARGYWEYLFANLPVRNDQGKVITYTVTEEPIPPYSTTIKGNADDGYTITNTYRNFPFRFTKKWIGDRLSGIKWTLYHADGTTADHEFVRKEISETEWYYESWFEMPEDYYLIESVPEGYQVRYINVGIHANVTDRCYNGGTMINYKVPRTGDRTNLPLLFGLAGISVVGLVLALTIGRKPQRR